MTIVDQIDWVPLLIKYAIAMSVIVLVVYPFINDMEHGDNGDNYTCYVLASVFACVLVPIVVIVGIFSAIFCIFPRIAREHRASIAFAEECKKNDKSYTIKPPLLSLWPAIFVIEVLAAAIILLWPSLSLWLRMR